MINLIRNISEDKLYRLKDLSPDKLQILKDLSQDKLHRLNFFSGKAIKTEISFSDKL